jgi:hypothetical protein
MSARFNVAEVVGVVEKTLSSIDIRTASVRIDNKWQNVMSVVRLSSDCIVTASVRVENVWGKHGSVHTDEFRIDYKVLPFTEWTALSGEFSAGQVRFTGPHLLELPLTVFHVGVISVPTIQSQVHGML